MLFYVGWVLDHVDDVTLTGPLHVGSGCINLDFKLLPLMGIERSPKALYRSDRQGRMSRLCVHQGQVAHSDGSEACPVPGHVQDHLESCQDGPAQQTGNIPIDDGGLDVNRGLPLMMAA